MRAFLAHGRFALKMREDSFAKIEWQERAIDLDFTQPELEDGVQWKESEPVPAISRIEVI